MAILGHHPDLLNHKLWGLDFTICVLTNLLDDSDAFQSLRSAAPKKAG